MDPLNILRGGGSPDVAQRDSGRVKNALAKITVFDGNPAILT
jgi:hypothetical protein